MTQTIKDIAQMKGFATHLLQKLSPQKEATILALSGDLGAGKTTFVKSLAKALGIKRIVQSPTFVIMKKYELKSKTYKFLIHIDAYRIEKDNELKILGWDELIKDPHNIITIEWPERVKNLIPKSARAINFQFVDEKTRTVSM